MGVARKVVNASDDMTEQNAGITRTKVGLQHCFSRTGASTGFPIRTLSIGWQCGMRKIPSWADDYCGYRGTLFGMSSSSVVNWEADMAIR